MHDFSTWVGTKIFRTIPEDISRRKNPRKRLVFNTNPRIRFIVFQLDIILGLVFFNQIVFEQKRIQLRIDNHVLNIRNAFYKQNCLAVVLRFVEIGGNSLF